MLAIIPDLDSDYSQAAAGLININVLQDAAISISIPELAHGLMRPSLASLSPIVAGLVDDPGVEADIVGAAWLSGDVLPAIEWLVQYVEHRPDMSWGGVRVDFDDRPGWTLAATLLVNQGENGDWYERSVEVEQLWAQEFDQIGDSLLIVPLPEKKHGR